MLGGLRPSMISSKLTLFGWAYLGQAYACRYSVHPLPNSTCVATGASSIDFTRYLLILD